MRSKKEAAYQAASEAVVASGVGAEVFGLEVRLVDPTKGMEDCQGRCLRAGGVLEFRTGDEIYEYEIYAGDDALTERIRRIGMYRRANQVGPELLTGESDPYIDLPSLIDELPIDHITGDAEEESALLRAYAEQAKEVIRNKWSLVESLAQRLIRRRSLDAAQITEVLEASDA